MRRLGSKRTWIGVVTALALAALLSLLFDPGLTGSSAASAAPGNRKSMPPMALSRLNGGMWDLASERGNVVLLNVWASWCPPCRQETPGLVRLSKSYAGRGLKVVGVSVDDDTSALRDFVRDFQIPYPVVLASEAFESSVDALPTTFLIDRHGRAAAAYAGAVSEARLAPAIEDLLAEPQSASMR